ncbi:rhodanese-like domain-containing protein [Pseudotamlana carrageenivorans]|uniref:Rhodanese-like domain-containing protein n=1 Tax=Pseudotamlana carrageenivorans TaxID=2069432 RepID=A0A2I7SI39_9FLAO|nr:rhodanese-like domain-containing protein [Tamlana carrageenivorans]AUS05549.1 rhodanese-like domain-containing protein [Tamlana carrageenivorans]
MKLPIIFFVGFFSCLPLYGQKTLEKLLEKYHQNTIPYLYVDSLAKHYNKFVLLDSRTPKEYQVSHLENAIFIGYHSFSLDSVIQKIPDKDTELVVYCSLGMRSEKIANKLKQAGYIHVNNLYGGIFQWKNNNLPVYNNQNKKTDSIHAFSKSWSKWLKNGIKVYE